MLLIIYQQLKLKVSTTRLRLFADRDKAIRMMNISS